MIKSSNNGYVVIIGSGLGGLSCGAKLALEGRRVLVLEQHDSYGGYANTFKRGKYTFDIGLHAVNSIYQKDDSLRPMLKELGVIDNIDFVRAPEFYNVRTNGHSYTVPDNPKEAIISLSKSFPHETEGIKKYINTITGLRREVMKLPRKRWRLLARLPFLPFKSPFVAKNVSKTAGSFIEDSVKDESLRLILAANVGFYHTDPYTYSQLHYGGAQGGYYLGGAAYIKGGSGKLSDHLVSVIKNSGGEVHLSSKAEKILLEKGKAVGVQYKDIKNNKTVDIKCKAVVVNASHPQFVDSLLPENAAASEAKRTKVSEHSLSLFAVYAGLKKPMREYGNTNYTTFIFPEKLKKLKDFAKHNYTNDFNEKVVSVVDYSAIDSGLVDNKNGIASIFTIDTLDNWQHLSSADYKTKKKKCRDILINRIDKTFPGFKSSIDICDAATPRTMKRYTLNPSGSIYGYSQNPKQVGYSRPNISTKIKGVYLASAWTRPGGGFMGAARAGYNAACDLLSDFK